MANQVKPFQSNIALGYFAWCIGDDYNEPEGTVFFDAPPNIGDTCILCDGKTWTVTKESNEQMEISVALIMTTSITISEEAKSVGKGMSEDSLTYKIVCERAQLAIDSATEKLTAENERLREVVEAVLLFHSASPWTEAKKVEWWNKTQTIEATTRNLCDAARLRLGKLPSCFGDFTGMLPAHLPPGMRLNHDQRNALAILKPQLPTNPNQGEKR